MALNLLEYELLMTTSFLTPMHLTMLYIYLISAANCCRAYGPFTLLRMVASIHL